MSAPTQQYVSDPSAAQYQATGQSQQGTGAQHAVQQPPASQASGTAGTLRHSLSPSMEHALQQFFEASNACEWCAERCVDEGPEMAECLRLCRDVSELASLNARFIARDSVFGPDLAQLFVTAAQECAQECSKHQHAHCQACAQTLEQAIQATQQLLQSLGSESALHGGHAQTTGGAVTSQRM
ncbi:four-helix bundle copper-binding protein [Halobellus sp. GM3]|uniref:four-helix bundle copper-binding protein n=1 Tax=Halobellus sp. GM3 TaxID=3458410 RepID=UPI00403E0482